MESGLRIKSDWSITLGVKNIAVHEFNFDVKINRLEELGKVQSLHIFLPKDEWSTPTAYINNLEYNDCVIYDNFGPSLKIYLQKLESHFINTDTVSIKVKTTQKICTPPIGDKYFYCLNIKPSAYYRDWHVLIKLPKPYGETRAGILRLFSKIKNRSIKGEIYSIDDMRLTPGASMSPYYKNCKDGEVKYKFDGNLSEGCGIIYSVMNFSSFWSLLIGLIIGFLGAVILEVITSFISTLIIKPTAITGGGKK